MKNLEMKGWEKSEEATVNDIFKLCPENHDESIFLQKFAMLVRQELMDDLTKKIENLAFFSHTKINLKGTDQMIHNYTNNKDLIERRLKEIEKNEN